MSQPQQPHYQGGGGGGGGRGGGRGYQQQQQQQQRPMGAWQPAAPTSLQVAAQQQQQQQQQYGHPQGYHNPYAAAAAAAQQGYHNPYAAAAAAGMHGGGAPPPPPPNAYSSPHNPYAQHTQYQQQQQQQQGRGGPSSQPPGAWSHTVPGAGGYPSAGGGAGGGGGGGAGGGMYYQQSPQQQHGHHHHRGVPQHHQQQQQQQQSQQQQSSQPPPPPRAKKPLVITDKNGNVVDLTGGASKKTTESSLASAATAATAASSSVATSAAAGGGPASSLQAAASEATAKQQPPSSSSSSMDAGAKMRQAALERIQNKDKQVAEEKRRQQEATAAAAKKKEEEEAAAAAAKAKEEADAAARKAEDEAAAAAKAAAEKAAAEKVAAEKAAADKLAAEKAAAEKASAEKAVRAAPGPAASGPKSSLSSMLAKQEKQAVEDPATTATSPEVAAAATPAPSSLAAAVASAASPAPRSLGGLRPGSTGTPSSGGLRPGGGGLRPGGGSTAASPTPSGPPSSATTAAGLANGKRIVYSKEDMIRLKSLPKCMIRPDDCPELVISKGPSKAGGGGGGGGGGGSRSGGDRQRGGDDRGGGGGGGGGAWARGAAPPPRRSSNQAEVGGGGGGGGGNVAVTNTGGGQWARGVAPPKPQPNQNQQGGRRGGGRGGRGGQPPPFYDGPVAPLVKSEKAWRPKKDNSALAVAEKMVKSILNKMTKEKFQRLANQMCEIPVESHDMLTMMICNVYEKAIDEPSFGDMYGDLCAMLSQHVQGNSFVKIIESDEEPPTEDGATPPPSTGAQSSSSHIVYRWSNDVSTTDSEIVGPFSSTEECIEVALDPDNEQPPMERGDLALELDKLIIKNGIFIKVMKKKDIEEGEENAFYTVYFPVADHKDCGQQLSAIFLSERECVSDAGKQNSFKRSLLNKCEDEFNKQDIYVDWKKEKAAYLESKSKLTDAERAEKEEELNFRRIKIKKQMLGNIKFIGQLYKKNLLKEKIMRYCIASLLKLEQKKEDVKNPGYIDTGDEEMDEEDHEAICSMFATIGSTIDRPPAADFIKFCFSKIKRLSTDTKLPSRSRFMYKDLIELRANNWVPRRKEEKAKTLDEIRKEVEREERLQAQQSQQQGGGNYRGGGGGGGRGDRNDYGGRGGGRGGDRGDFRSNSRQSNNFSSGGGSSSNRSRAPKPTAQTDDDGFTVIGGASAPVVGSTKPKSSLAQAAQSSSKSPVSTNSKFGALADDGASSKPAPLDTDKFERRVKSMRSEFAQDPKNVEELLLSFDELSGTPDAGKTLVSLNCDRIMDCKDDERKAVFAMISLLVEKGKLTGDDVKNGMMDIIEFIDSFVCDAPKAYDYLGGILYAGISVGAVDMAWLCEQCEKTKESLKENPEKIMKALAGVIETSEGKAGVNKIFGDTKSLEKLFGATEWTTLSKSIL